MFNRSRRSFLRNIVVLSSLWGVGLKTARAKSTSNQLIALDIRNFGAIGDGLNDDSDALDKALSLVTAKGGELLFPHGIYRITRPLKYQLLKDVILQGNGATLLFDYARNPSYGISFSGKKTVSGVLSKNIRMGSKEWLESSSFSSDAIILLEQVNHEFISLNLSLSNSGKAQCILSSQQAFFKSEMTGKSLVNDKDGTTFLIIAILDRFNALVILGNNQAKQPDFSNYPKWAVVDLWCAARGYYIKGEFINLKKSKNSSYLCCDAIWDNYASKQTQISMVKSGKLRINGLTVDGGGGNYGVMLVNLVGLELKQLTITNCMINSLQIEESYQVKILNSVIEVAVTNLPSNYAGCINSSQNVNIIGCKFSGGTHSLSHGGTIPCRNIQITNTSFSKSKSWTLDFHGNIQGVVLTSVIADGGGYIGAIDVKIQNSVFRNSSTIQGALVLGPERDSKFYQITNCKVNNLQGNGLVIANQFVIHSIQQLLISTSTIVGTKNGILVQAYPYGKSPLITKMMLVGNNISAPTQISNVNNINKFIINKE